MLIDLIPRALIGGAVAGAVATFANRQRQLTSRGAWAAFAIGTASAVGGVSWAATLLVFFQSSTMLSAWNAGEKRQRSYHVLPDAAARDAVQVMANGALFAACAIIWGATGNLSAGLFGFGALAAATADTWATEIGMVLQAAPRHILSGQPVAPGTSGGVSAAGFGAAIAGAFLIALCAVVSFGTPFDVPRLEAVLVGGLAGSLVDSLLGALLQSRRWCEQCRQWTERRVHTCGYRSRHARGLRWMTNDVVNLVATAAGGFVATLVAGT